MGFGPFFVCGTRDASMAALEAVMEPAVAGLGYELVDVQASNGGGVLRLFIDKPGGVGIEDCAAGSRHLTRVLAGGGGGHEGPEVAPPRLGRPFGQARAFSRLAGGQGGGGK